MKFIAQGHTVNNEAEIQSQDVCHPKSLHFTGHCKYDTQHFQVLCIYLAMELSFT